MSKNGGKMNRRLSINSQRFIHSRNQFMTILLCILFLISFIGDFTFHCRVLNITVPFAIISVSVIIYLNRKKKFPYITLYTIITVLYLHIFLIIYFEPILIHFILLWLALLVSAVYYRIIPAILYALILTCIISIYSFVKYKQTLFFTNEFVEVLFLIIFIIFVTGYIIFSSQFIERRRREAEISRDLATDELMEVKYYLESLFNQMTDAVVIHDRLGKVFKVNKRFEEIYLWKEDDVIGQEIPYGGREQFLLLRQLWDYVYREDTSVQDYQMKLKTKNGHEIDVEVSICSIRDYEGRVIALATFSKDISEKLIAEEMILRSEKLSVVGQLAAGVAHEIRNPLTVISGFLQLYQQNDKDNVHIPLMLKEISRINEIINEFLVLSKPEVESFRNVDLQELIYDVTTLISTTAIMENIGIQTKFLTEDVTIECVPNQIKQVIINLLKNSIDAMQKGGTIEVTVDKPSAKEIMIVVRDEGEGMNETQLGKIGEPFYTTKEKGTGLGLMICFKIIDNHHGKMTFKSELQKGTTAEIRLPIKQKGGSAASKKVCGGEI